MIVEVLRTAGQAIMGLALKGEGETNEDAASSSTSTAADGQANMATEKQQLKAFEELVVKLRDLLDVR